MAEHNIPLDDFIVVSNLIFTVPNNVEDVHYAGFDNYLTLGFPRVPQTFQTSLKSVN